MRDIEKINVPANVKDLYKKELEKCIDEHGSPKHTASPSFIFIQFETA